VPPPLPERIERPPGKCHFCQEVLHYASVGAQPTIIANYLKISRRKILLNCQRELRAGRAKYHLALRGYQVDVAKKGSVNILIHLGKTELGQVPKEIEERPLPEPRYRP